MPCGPLILGFTVMYRYVVEPKRSRRMYALQRQVRLKTLEGYGTGWYERL